MKHVALALWSAVLAVSCVAPSRPGPELTADVCVYSATSAGVKLPPSGAEKS